MANNKLVTALLIFAFYTPCSFALWLCPEGHYNTDQASLCNICQSGQTAHSHTSHYPQATFQQHLEPDTLPALQTYYRDILGFGAVAKHPPESGTSRIYTRAAITWSYLSPDILTEAVTHWLIPSFAAYAHIQSQQPSTKKGDTLPKSHWFTQIMEATYEEQELPAFFQQLNKAPHSSLRQIANQLELVNNSIDTLSQEQERLSDEQATALYFRLKDTVLPIIFIPAKHSKGVHTFVMGAAIAHIPHSELGSFIVNLETEGHPQQYLPIKVIPVPQQSSTLPPKNAGSRGAPIAHLPPISHIPPAPPLPASLTSTKSS